MAFRSGGPPKMGPVPPPSGPPGGMMGGPPRPGPQPMAPPPSLGPPNGTPGPPNFAQPRPPTSQSGGGLAPPPMSVPPVSAPPTSFGGNNVPPLGPPPTSFGGPNSAPPPPPASSTSFGGSYQQPPTRPPLTNGSQNPKYPAYPTNNIAPQSSELKFSFEKKSIYVEQKNVFFVSTYFLLFLKWQKIHFSLKQKFRISKNPIFGLTKSHNFFELILYFFLFRSTSSTSSIWRRQFLSKSKCPRKFSATYYQTSFNEWITKSKISSISK